MVLSQEKLNALGQKHSSFQLFCQNIDWTFMCQPAALNPGGCTGPCSHKALMEPECPQLNKKKKSEVIGQPIDISLSH